MIGFYLNFMHIDMLVCFATAWKSVNVSYDFVSWNICVWFSIKRAILKKLFWVFLCGDFFKYDIAIWTHNSLIYHLFLACWGFKLKFQWQCLWNVIFLRHDYTLYLNVQVTLRLYNLSLKLNNTSVLEQNKLKEIWP